jgi:hypothetical protein
MDAGVTEFIEKIQKINGLLGEVNQASIATKVASKDLHKILEILQYFAEDDMRDEDREEYFADANKRIVDGLKELRAVPYPEDASVTMVGAVAYLRIELLRCLQRCLAGYYARLGPTFDVDKLLGLAKKACQEAMEALVETMPTKVPLLQAKLAVAGFDDLFFEAERDRKKTKKVKETLKAIARIGKPPPKKRKSKESKASKETKAKPTPLSKWGIKDPTPAFRSDYDSRYGSRYAASDTPVPAKESQGYYPGKYYPPAAATGFPPATPAPKSTYRSAFYDDEPDGWESYSRRKL